MNFDLDRIDYRIEEGGALIAIATVTIEGAVLKFHVLRSGDRATVVPASFALDVEPQQDVALAILARMAADAGYAADAE